MKNTTKLIAGILAFILIGGVLWFANGLVGNPVSKMLANRSAEKYIAEKYGDMELEVSKAGYNFKTGGYYVSVKSLTSIDTHFSINISPYGQIGYDLYDYNVLRKFNTWRRIDSEYRNMVSKIFDSDNFTYQSDINFGQIIRNHSKEGTDYIKPFGPEYGLTFDDLIIDKIYDIKEISKNAGHLVLYIDDDQVNSKRASNILMNIKNIFDDADISFYTIDFCLQEPIIGDNYLNRNKFQINEFLYSDIYEEDLTKRLEEAAKFLQEYFEKEDTKKSEFKDKVSK